MSSGIPRLPKIPVFRAQGANFRARSSRGIIADVAANMAANGVNPWQ
jgi:hypothetical protein